MFLKLRFCFTVVPLLAILVQLGFGEEISAEAGDSPASEFEPNSAGDSIGDPDLGLNDGLSLRSVQDASSEVLDIINVVGSNKLLSLVNSEEPLISRSIDENFEIRESEETSNEEALKEQNEIFERSINDPSFATGDENSLGNELEEEHIEKRDPEDDDDSELYGEPEDEIVGEEGDDEEGEGAEEPEPELESNSEEPEIDIDTEEHTTDPTHPLISVDELECYKCSSPEDCEIPLDEMDTYTTSGQSDPEDPKQAYCVVFYALDGANQGKAIKRYGKLEWVELVDGVDTGCDYRIDKEVEVCWCTRPLCNGDKFPCSKRKASNPQSCSTDALERRSAAYLPMSVLVKPFNQIETKS